MLPYTVESHATRVLTCGASIFFAIHSRFYIDVLHQPKDKVEINIQCSLETETADESSITRAKRIKAWNFIGALYYIELG